MRAAAVACLLLCLALPAADAQTAKDKDKKKAEPKKQEKFYEEIWGRQPIGLKVGNKGYWYANGNEGSYYDTRVVEVIDKDTMVMQLGRHPAFLVRGEPTADLADGEIHHLKGEWKVTGTKKVSGKTMHVVEPVKKDKK